METVILVIHLFLALAIIGLVLIQRSEGGGLGIGGGGGGMGKLATARGTANILTRATAICAGCFFVTSLTLGILAGTHSKDRGGLIEAVADMKPAPAASSTLEQPAAPAEAAPAAEGKSSKPAAPIAD